MQKEIFMAKEGVLIVKVHGLAFSLAKGVEKDRSDILCDEIELYNKWIASRTEIAQTLDPEKTKIYNAITENVIDGLCNLILEEE